MIEILNSSIHTTLDQNLSEIYHYNGKIRKFCLLVQLGRYLDPVWRTVARCKIAIAEFVVIYMISLAQKWMIFSKKWILKLKWIEVNPFSLHSLEKSNLVEFWESLKAFFEKIIHFCERPNILITINPKMAFLHFATVLQNRSRYLPSWTNKQNFWILPL